MSFNAMNSRSNVRKMAPQCGQDGVPHQSRLIPAAVVTPAARPVAIESDIKRIMPWPGVMINAREAATNSNYDGSSTNGLLGNFAALVLG
jgi:hypothetical protein